MATLDHATTLSTSDITDMGTLITWFVAWTVLWLLASELLAHKVPSSTLAEENRKPYLAQLMTATLRSIIVGVGAFYARADDTVLLNHCGYAFLAYESVDLIIGSWFGLHTKDMLVHHMVHIAAGGVVMTSAKASLYALAKPLLAQEMSSILLNAFVYQRNRNPAIAPACFVGFALLFAMFRLGGGTIAAYTFLMKGTHPVLGICVAFGAVMQWYWGWTISLKVRRQLSGSAKQA